MKKFLLVSFFFHMALVGVFYFFPQDFLWFNKPHAPKFIEDSIRVDIVGMPSQTLKELEKLQPSQTIVEEEKKEDTNIKEENVEETESKDEKIIAIKEMKPKENKASSNKNVVEKKKKKISIDGLDELVRMGNQISKGESVDSDKISNQDLELIDSYILRVKEKVRAFWELPAHLIDSGHRCEVQLFISAEGKLLKAVFIEASESDEFNKLVMEVLEKSTPFAKPDEGLRDKVRNGLVGLVFPF